MRAVKLTKIGDFNNYKYFRYVNWFVVSESFSLSDGNGLDKNVIIFGADMILSVHVNNKRKYILILAKAPKQGLHNTILTVEK